MKMQIKKGKSCQIVMFRGKLFSTSADMEFPALYLFNLTNFLKSEKVCKHQKFIKNQLIWLQKSNNNLSNQRRIRNIQQESFWALVLVWNFPNCQNIREWFSCNSSSVDMDFLHSFMSGLPQPAVLEWFISTSGEATSACKPF